MKNREIFKTLRYHVGPIASDLGFTALPNTGTDLPWTRQLKEGRHETVWCQIDKWPWDTWLGTKFTVNFLNAKAPGCGLSRGAKMARIGALLAGEHQTQAERIQNAAIQKIKAPSAREYNEQMGLELADGDDSFWLDQYHEASRPVKFGNDPGDLWLRIVDAEDLTAWALFLAAWLPAGIACFAKLEGEQCMW